MEFDPGRRRILKLIGGLIVAPAVSLLNVQTAFAAQAVDCPIYMFHQGGGAAVDSVIRANLREGRMPVTVSELAEMLLDEREVPEQGMFCLTFDDGYRIQYEQALPVLNRYEAAATFFVMSTSWRGDRVHTYMSNEQIIHLSQLGYEIGSHTINHDPNLIALRAGNFPAYLAEIYQSQEELQELVQKPVTAFCYPNGVHNAVIRADVDKAYKASVSTIHGTSQTTDIIQQLRRVRVN